MVTITPHCDGLGINSCMLSSSCIVILEEDEFSTSVVDREPPQVDPATGMLEVHCNTDADYDDSENVF